MIKIMFVCHGNICRSPMAEFIFKKMVSDAGREDEFYVASSATSTEEIWNGIGNPVYPPAREELLRHGIDPRGKRAVQLKRDDLEKYDLFVCMDRNNIRGASRILGSDDKLCLLKDFTDGGNVSDPWYSGDFVTAYNDIYEGCKALLKKY
ncbi:MAG: low molecular weight phosphotyrosine protein phosphatase [Clostridia bacterium]|nr:low molecular weight phosphotyrosine protein phosphatase [Clostridia bacterium]